MNKEDIETILTDYLGISASITSTILYKKVLRDTISLLESVVEHPTKSGYKRHDVLDKIKKLKQELKTLEK